MLLCTVTCSALQLEGRLRAQSLHLMPAGTLSWLSCFCLKEASNQAPASRWMLCDESLRAAAPLLELCCLLHGMLVLQTAALHCTGAQDIDWQPAELQEHSCGAELTHQHRMGQSEHFVRLLVLFLKLSRFIFPCREAGKGLNTQCISTCGNNLGLLLNFQFGGSICQFV